MAKKLLSVSSVAAGALLVAACTGNPGEPAPEPDAAVYDAPPTDGPPRDGCDPSMNDAGDASTAAGVLPPLPC